MKLVLILFCLYSIESFAQKLTGSPPGSLPPFGSSYEKCVEWGEAKPPKEIDGNLVEFPSECIRYGTCREEAVPGEPVLVSCACYFGLTQGHPNWCENCDYPSSTAIGVGDSKDLAEEEARAICNLRFKEAMSGKDPTHFDFKVNYCRQKGREVCE